MHFFHDLYTELRASWCSIPDVKDTSLTSKRSAGKRVHSSVMSSWNKCQWWCSKRSPYKIDVRAVDIQWQNFTANPVLLTCSRPMRSFSMRRRVPSRGIFIILLVKSDALHAGHQAEEGSWPENRKSCANVFICMLQVNICVHHQKAFFSLSFFFLFCELETPQGAAMLVHSLPVRSRKEQWFLMTWCIWLKNILKN